MIQSSQRLLKKFKKVHPRWEILFKKKSSCSDLRTVSCIFANKIASDSGNYILVVLTKVSSLTRTIFNTEVTGLEPVSLKFQIQVVISNIHCNK